MIFEEVQKQLAVAPREWGTKEFFYIRLFVCGACGSGVTAEEKFKHRKDGSSVRYVYYHCTGGTDRTCKQPYVREEDILKQLVMLMDKIDLKKIGVREKLQQEIARFERFTQGVLQDKDGTKSVVSKVNIRTYAKYILESGSIEEKRELLGCLKSELKLKDGKVYLGD